MQADTQEQRIRATCPDCGSVVAVGYEHAGRRIRCQQCGSAIHVPVGGPPPARSRAAGRAAADVPGYSLASVLIGISWVALAILGIIAFVGVASAGDSGDWSVVWQSAGDVLAAGMAALLVMAAGVGLRLLCRLVRANEQP